MSYDSAAWCKCLTPVGTHVTGTPYAPGRRSVFYFEANGHGTVLFSPATLAKIRSAAAEQSNASRPVGTHVTGTPYAPGRRSVSLLTVQAKEMCKTHENRIVRHWSLL
jgi:hypothetical protein